ncbi:IS110 family transposase, partial [Herbaspirillum sp. GCM10030257]|uniref:IS110 family transposase n=1 Tax=Herbaspirillum sp. GCM10030257 TaxID=3273393 RepID=UPI003611AD7D
MRIVAHAFPTYGIDLGKTSFQVVGTDLYGKPGLRIKLRRDGLIEFFAKAQPALIGMESCPGAHWLARRLLGLGHKVRLIPPQFVKPYLKSNKNDTLDAEAIAEAVTRPTMRFVPVKRHDQLEIQALHRVREHLIHQRTAVINQCRSFLLEYGIAIRVGAGVFKHDFPHILSDDANELTPAMRQLLTDLWSDFNQLELRITSLSRQIESTANRDDAARRLMSIPGIGPLGASAMCAAIG